MKLQTKRNDKYTSLFFSTKIPLINKTFRWHTILYNSPNTWVRGYSSRTIDGKYVLFHDYDKLDYASIVGELEYLQKKFKLSNYYVFKLDREDSFHAVCLDTFCIGDAYEIQKTTSSDLAFVHSIKNLQTREWVLRWYKKGEREAPKFLTCIPSKYRVHIRSSAHADFLERLGVSKAFIDRKGLWDNGKVLALIDYDTANRVVK